MVLKDNWLIIRLFEKYSQIFKWQLHSADSFPGFEYFQSTFVIGL